MSGREEGREHGDVECGSWGGPGPRVAEGRSAATGVARDQPTVVFDLDGVLCEETGLGHTDYATRRPLNGIALLNEVRAKGFRIVIHTARWVEDRDETERWLRANNVRYDELVLGKPAAVAYIDDRALRFPMRKDIALLLIGEP
jgi:hypothetical protein